MLPAEMYRAQADMLLEFMENNGIKQEALDVVLGRPAWSAASIHQISMAQYRAKVFKLYKDGVKQSDIARMTGRSQSSIAMLLQRARQKGEIEKRAYDARGRIKKEGN
jgi:DNA-binding MarR family transcriptional regulator